MKKLILFFIVMMFVSCSKVGEYVYISPRDHGRGVVFHVDRECDKITVCERKSIDEYKKLISKGRYYTFCNKCVDDRTYQELLKIAKENR